MRAFKFSITREYSGVIVAENADQARAALKGGKVSIYDCIEAEEEIGVHEVDGSEVDRADSLDALFDVDGDSISAKAVVLDSEKADEVPL